MYIAKVTDDYNDTLSINNNCTNNDDSNIEIVIPLITIVLCGMSLIYLISLMVYTLIQPLSNKNKLIKMEKILYPNHPVRCIITGPSCSGKSVLLTNLILNIINEYDKK